MLVGVMVNYGIRYNFLQQTQMSAFRMALRDAAAPIDPNNPNQIKGSGAVTLIQDSHIPNPANPFAVGSVMPFNASASVIRSCRLHETPNNYQGLPEMKIIIRGNEDKAYFYKTAGFRIESVAKKDIDKYYEIFGALFIKDAATGKDPFPSPSTPPETVKSVKIMDMCEGEIISYDTCKRQCRMITDVAFCTEECSLGLQPGQDDNCAATCNEQMALPWYCATGALDNIFSFADVPKSSMSMGVQQDYSKETTMNSSLTTNQSAGGKITNTDNINWSDTTHRRIAILEHLDHATGITTTVPGGITTIRTDSQFSEDKVIQNLDEQ